MQSFLDDLTKVKGSVELSPEVKASNKLKLMAFMEAPAIMQQEMLSEFEEQESVTLPINSVKTSASVANKNFTV